MSIVQAICLGLSVSTLFGAVLASAPAAQTPVRPRFVLQDLGVLPPVAGDTALGLNNSGVVTLWVRTGVVSVRASLWAGVTPPPLEPSPAGYHSSLARGINDRGQWVGWVTTGDNPVDSLTITRVSSALVSEHVSSPLSEGATAAPTPSILEASSSAAPTAPTDTVTPFGTTGRS